MSGALWSALLAVIGKVKEHKPERSLERFADIKVSRNQKSLDCRGISRKARDTSDPRVEYQRRDEVVNAKYDG